jgi:hypothetical protein
VETLAGSNNTIGGTTTAQGNIISANGGWGLELDKAVTENWNTVGWVWNTADPPVLVKAPNGSGGQTGQATGGNDKVQA